MSDDCRVGVGSDLHRLVPGRPLWLGTVRVDYTLGLLAHSDGDVLCHAVADALLGAAGLGEIGLHFPATDPQWKGITGAALLGRIARLLAASGWGIANVDAVVIAEEPPLSPYRDAMVAGIAAAVGVEPGVVSLKIKSNEGVDAVGRGEAIAAQAVALVVRRPRLEQIEH